MKELIEKINNTINEIENIIQNNHQKGLYTNHPLFAELMTLTNVLKEIEDQESKPFNPLECGFSIRYNKEDQEEEIFLEKHQVFYIIEKMNTPNRFLLKTRMKHSFSVKTHDNEFVNYIPFKASNHRQGVELLQNLGVIE